MKISTRNSPAVRLISVTTVGVFVVIGMFAMLYRLVDVPFDAPLTHRPLMPEFTSIVDPPRRIIDPPIEPIEPPPPTEFTPITTLVNPGPSEPERLGPPNGTDISRWNPPTGPRGLGGTGPVGGTDTDAMAVVRIPPLYPVRAETRGIEGWVRVRFTISPNGSVRDARVVAAEPTGEFEEAALTAIERWRYNPRIVDGVAVDRVGV